MKLQYLLMFILCNVACAQEEYEGYYGYWLDVVASAYSPEDPIDSVYHGSKGPEWRWKTADGRTNVKTTPYGIAVPLARVGNKENGRKLNKPWFPFGTKVIIPTGYKYLDNIRKNDRVFKIDDVGDGKEYYVKKNGKLHIDVRFIGHKDAIEWAGPLGYREIKVFIVTGVVPPKPVPKPVPEPVIIESVAVTSQINYSCDVIPVLDPPIVPPTESIAESSVLSEIYLSDRSIELILLTLSLFIPLYLTLFILIHRFVTTHREVIAFKVRIAILWSRRLKCITKNTLKKYANLALETN